MQEVYIEGKKLNLFNTFNNALNLTIEKEGEILNGRSERLFASYLAQNLAKGFNRKIGRILKVDSPYNKHLNKTKRLQGRVIELDIAVHVRGSDRNNILAIELETTNSPRGDDVWKIIELTKRPGEYEYILGLYIVLGVDKRKGEIIAKDWYCNGSKLKLESLPPIAR